MLWAAQGIFVLFIVLFIKFYLLIQGMLLRVEKSTGLRNIIIASFCEGSDSKNICELKNMSGTFFLHFQLAYARIYCYYSVDHKPQFQHHWCPVSSVTLLVPVACLMCGRKRNQCKRNFLGV